MTHRWLPLLANGFVAVYAFDSALSSLDEMLRATTGSTLLVEPRAFVAVVALGASVLCLAALSLTPRLPLSVFLPLCLSALWLNLGAAPVPLWIDSPAALGLVLSWSQVAVAVVALLRVRQLNGGHGWRLRSGAFEGPALSLRHSLGSALVAVLLLLPAGLLYLGVLAATWVELGTEGFVSFDFAGISLADRLYTRDDREVRLVGMMHLGEGDAYRNLVAGFGSPSTVVLAEGVSDEQGLLDVPLSYEQIAAVIGLEEQGAMAEYLAESHDGELPEWPVVRHADVDLSTFDPTTREWLGRIASVWSSDSPLAELMQLQRRMSAQGDVWAVISRDILDRRNAHLLTEIDVALEEFQRVIVPWGALHLSVIESSLIEQGFEPTDSQLRRFVSWHTVAAAVL